MSRYLAAVWFAHALALALTAGAAWAAAAPANITIVTDHAHPVSGIARLRDQRVAVRVLYLDAPQRLLARINRNLPSDPKAAAAVARKRVHAIGTARFKRAYAALQTALAVRLKRYPAIIFDQRAIVLGVTDLNEALADYRRWRDGERLGDQR